MTPRMRLKIRDISWVRSVKGAVLTSPTCRTVLLLSCQRRAQTASAADRLFSAIWAPCAKHVACLIAPALPPAIPYQPPEALQDMRGQGAMRRRDPLRQLSHLGGHKPLDGLPQLGGYPLLLGSRPTV